MFDPDRHHRRSIRLPSYDYSSAGVYFVTICTHDRACLFGEVVDGETQLNDVGRAVRSVWNDIPAHFASVDVDASVVMPNHVHGLVVVGARHAVPLRDGGQNERFGQPAPGTLSTIVRSFKSAATRSVNMIRGTRGAPVWQRNFFEHVVRDDEDLARILEYVADNPRRWADDPENPGVKAR